MKKYKCLKQKYNYMEKNLHDLDKLFQRSLENYEEEPAEDIWVSIENGLNRTDAEKYKTKYKLLLRTVACFALLLTSLLLNDTIQTYTSNLKRNDANIERLKVKPSTEKNATENKSNSNTQNNINVSKPPKDYLYPAKKDVLNNNIESADNKTFQDDKLYSHIQIQALDKLMIFNKKNKFLLPENFPEINIDPKKWLHSSARAWGNNL